MVGGGDEELRGRQRVADRGVGRVHRQPARLREPAETHRRRRDAVALGQPQPRDQRGVEHRLAQAHADGAQGGAEKGALDRRVVGDEHATGHRLEQRIERVRERGSVGEIGGADAVHPDRLLSERPGRAHEPVHGAVEADPAVASTGTAPTEMISWRRGSSPLSSRSRTQ